MSTLAEDKSFPMPLNTGKKIIVGLAQWAFAILCGIPPLIIIALITQAGTLPDNDYWDMLSTILQNGRFSPHVIDWLAHSTEHIVLIPKLIYALNIKFTGGDNRALGLITFFFAILEAAVLFSSLRKYFTAPEKHFAMLAVVIFIFTPTAAHNWMLGMSGVAWIGANTLAVGAFYFVTQQRIHLGCVLAVLGILTYGTALGIWPALLIGALLARHPLAIIKKIVVYACLTALIFLVLYHKPPEHPDLQRDIFTILKYLLTLLGGIFTSQDIALAQKAGGLGLSLLAVILWRLFKSPALWKASSLWLMIVCYALVNMAIIAVARSGFGIEQALATRYMTLPALFWLSWFCLALLAWRTLPRLGNWRYPVFLSCLAGFALASFAEAQIRASSFIERSQKKPLAMLSIYTGAYDFGLLSRIVTPIIKTEPGKQIAANLIPQLKIIHHIPFDGTFAPCPQMGEKLNTLAQTNAEKKMDLTWGFFDHANLMDPLTFKLDGWARPYPHSKIFCIAITNQDRIVRGIALSGFPRKDVNRYLNRPGNFGWKGYAKVEPDDKRLLAFVLTGNPLQWYRLKKSHPLPDSDKGILP